jgi:LacI family transcriptional regulator
LLNLAHPLPPLLTVENVSEEVFTERFKQWLDKNKPDAILTVDARLIPALKRLHLRIPQDVAVASTTVVDIPVSAGINQDSEEIGRVGVETLIALINSNDRGKPTITRKILVEGTWVDGDSLPDRRVAEPKPA